MIIAWASRLSRRRHVRYSYYYKSGTKSDDGLTQRPGFLSLYLLKGKTRAVALLPKASIICHFIQGLAHLVGAADFWITKRWSGHYPFPLILSSESIRSNIGCVENTPFGIHHVAKLRYGARLLKG